LSQLQNFRVPVPVQSRGLDGQPIGKARKALLHDSSVNGIEPVTVSSTRMLITEDSGGFTHTFKPPQQVGPQSEESIVRAELAKLEYSLEHRGFNVAADRK